MSVTKQQNGLFRVDLPSAPSILLTKQQMDAFSAYVKGWPMPAGWSVRRQGEDYVIRGPSEYFVGGEDDG